VCVLDAAEAALRRANVPFMRLDGATPAPRRAALVASFEAKDSLLRVALLSIGAAGVGITLTAATRVLFAELSWTPGLLLQAEDRAHRLGQTRPVRIEYLLSAGTIDDIMWPVLRAKLAVTAAALDGGGGGAGGAGGGLRVTPRAEEGALWREVRVEEMMSAAAASEAGKGVARRLAMPPAGAGRAGGAPAAVVVEDVIDLSQDSDGEGATAPPPPKRARPAAASAFPSPPPAAATPSVRRQSGAAGDAIELD
jgi:hypothetical protein